MKQNILPLLALLAACGDQPPAREEPKQLPVPSGPPLAQQPPPATEPANKQ